MKTRKLVLRETKRVFRNVKYGKRKGTLLNDAYYLPERFLGDLFGWGRPPKKK